MSLFLDIRAIAYLTEGVVWPFKGTDKEMYQADKEEAKGEFERMFSKIKDAGDLEAQESCHVKVNALERITSQTLEKMNQVMIWLMVDFSATFFSFRKYE